MPVGLGLGESWASTERNVLRLQTGQAVCSWYSWSDLARCCSIEEPFGADLKANATWFVHCQFISGTFVRHYPKLDPLAILVYCCEGKSENPWSLPDFGTDRCANSLLKGKPGKRQAISKLLGRDEILRKGRLVQKKGGVYSAFKDCCGPPGLWTHAYTLKTANTYIYAIHISYEYIHIHTYVYVYV